MVNFFVLTFGVLYLWNGNTKKGLKIPISIKNIMLDMGKFFECKCFALQLYILTINALRRKLIKCNYSDLDTVCVTAQRKISMSQICCTPSICSTSKLHILHYLSVKNNHIFGSLNLLDFYEICFCYHNFFQ